MEGNARYRRFELMENATSMNGILTSRKQIKTISLTFLMKGYRPIAATATDSRLTTCPPTPRRYSDLNQRKSAKYLQARAAKKRR